MIILVANIGSTSFKYRLLKAEGCRCLAEGRSERIGQAGGSCPSYVKAIENCLEEIAGERGPLGDISEVDGVAFKAVHAGPITGTRLVDEALIAAMQEFSFLAPAHNPAYIEALRAFQTVLPQVPLIAVFETGFFESLDDVAVTYAVPFEWKEQFGVRRYGFHGASHRAASEFLQGGGVHPPARHISCHLGGSSSLAAIRDGKAVATSFGMSPQSGLPQTNRVGDIDAFAVLLMMKKLNLNPDQMALLLASKSGLAGISGFGGDVRDLQNAADAGNTRARLALDVLIQSARHYIGAFAVELGGLDVLTFSGGIGENSAVVRSSICKDLAILGIKLDHQLNRSIGLHGAISAIDSTVEVLVIPADEERVVANSAAALLMALGDPLQGAGQINRVKQAQL